MISTKLHCSIDAFDIGNTFHLDESSFVDHGDQDAVYNETCSLVHLNGGLADLCGDLLDGVNGLLRSVHACDHLNQLHSVSGIEEMHTDHGSGQAVSDLSDGKAGSVGSKYALRLADLVKLTESGLLNSHILESSLNDQIAVSAKVFLQAGSDLGKNAVNSLLSQFSFLNKLSVSLSDLVLTALCPFLLDIAESNLITFNLSKCLCNALSHGTSTDNTYLHCSSSL